MWRRGRRETLNEQLLREAGITHQSPDDDPRNARTHPGMSFVGKVKSVIRRRPLTAEQLAANAEAEALAQQVQAQAEGNLNAIPYGGGGGG